MFNPNANNHLYTGYYDVVIVTQDYALTHFLELYLHFDLFIFDEDITPRFYSTETVSYSDLEMYLKLMEREEIMEKSDSVKEWLDEAKQTAQNTPLPPLPRVHVSGDAMVGKMSNDLPPFDIWRLMDEGSGIAKGTATIYYTTKREMPDAKLIVLSATADETAYRLLFGERLVSYSRLKIQQQKL